MKNTYAYGSNKLIAVSGVSDLIIIDTPDSLLVMNKHNAEQITSLISKLKTLDRHELDEHRKVYRPWGHYDLLGQGNDFKVKQIVISPGAKLSLQKHNYRAEHWVVISGIATITCGNKTFNLGKNGDVKNALGIMLPNISPDRLVVENWPSNKKAISLDDRYIVTFENQLGIVAKRVR